MTTRPWKRRIVTKYPVIMWGKPVVDLEKYKSQDFPVFGQREA